MLLNIDGREKSGHIAYEKQSSYRSLLDSYYSQKLITDRSDRYSKLLDEVLIILFLMWITRNYRLFTRNKNIDVR